MILQISKIKSREVKGREIKKIKCFYNHIPCVISLNPGIKSMNLVLLFPYFQRQLMKLRLIFLCVNSQDSGIHTWVL